MKAIVVGVVVIASAAGATYYLDERFEGTPFPPPGWGSSSSGHGSWTRTAGGPWGYFAQVNIFGGGSYNGWATLQTGDLYIPQGKTIYYRFNYRGEGNAYAIGVQGYFYIYYSGTTTTVVSTTLGSGFNGDWHEANGTGTISQALPVVTYWRLTASSYNMHGGGGWMSIDNCQISDEVMTVVGPASFGRVKAIYR